MPIWLQPLIGFLGQRFNHFIMYALIALITIGIPYKLFWKDTNKMIVKSGGIYNSCEKETPILGCSISKIKAKLIWQ